MLALLLLSTWFHQIAVLPSPAGPPAHVMLREESVVAERSGRRSMTTSLPPGHVYESEAGEILPVRRPL